MKNSTHQSAGEFLDQADDDYAPAAKQPENVIPLPERSEPALGDVLSRAGRLMKEGRTAEAAELVRNWTPDEETRARQCRSIARRDLYGIRTRFFALYAKTHNVRYSALLFLIAVKTKEWYDSGLRGERCACHIKVGSLARHIGCSKANVFRLLDQARQNGHLEHARRMRCLSVWVCNKNIFAELRRHRDKGEHDPLVLGYYNLRLARLFGPNASIAFMYLRKLPASGERPKATSSYFALAFPWLSEQCWRKELEKLHRYTLLKRCHYSTLKQPGRDGYAYFWTPRDQNDREKWAKGQKNLPEK